MRKPSLLLILMLSIVIVVLDQISKYWMETTLLSELNQLYESGTSVVIPDLLSWSLAYNTGAAFSFLAEAGGWQRWFFMVTAIFAVVLIFIWIKRLDKHEGLMAWGLSLILGGAIGNLIDRVCYGHVVDFILVHWKTLWYFPAFNLADTAITMGAIALGIDMLIFNRRSKDEATP